MNVLKTAATLEGLLDLGKGDSIRIESFGQRAVYTKENEEYNLTLHVTRNKDTQTKEESAEKETAVEKIRPAGIIIP